jgi:serine protease Do
MIPGNGRWLLVVVLTLVLQLSVTAGAVDLDAGTQRDIRAATFEVVQLKPPDGEVTYERALPLELIPYQQRIDLYRSIGTAFAIGPNRFVTAGHVLGVGAGSQFGPPALRDAAGHVYPIYQVLQYSQHEDFAVISLRDPPQHVQVLKAGARPALNDVVFAVGNALGEGVVIRDGVFTSESPEEQEGKWNWLRFSAAASPGNSGGPLVNRRGQLLGVVLRKSPSENLNYALAIEQVLNAKQGEGRVSGRTSVRLPIMDTAESAEYDEHFPMPLELPEFYKTWFGILEKENGRQYAQLFAHNEAHVFPHGAGSEKLLHQVELALVPQRIHEAQNHVWTLDAAKYQTVQLEHNGFVDFTGDMVRLRAPDDVEVSSLNGDSKLQMDLFLKAYTLRRIVGTDSVRVTSLGKARTEETYTDTYGRIWQVRAWAVPNEDMLLTMVSLPTPEGYAGVYFRIPTGFWHVAMAQQERLLDFVYLTMQGSLSRWQSYLAQKGVQPKSLGEIKIDVAGQQHVRYQSRRIDLDVSSNLVRLSDSSILRLNFAFFRDGDGVVWDVASVWVSEGPNSRNSVLAWRKAEPSSDLPDAFQDDWHKLQSREFPYNATVSSEEGETRISTTAIPPGPAEGGKIRYVLRVVGEGTQPQEAMKKKLDMLKRAFKQLEQ